jgi:hypothetical protein
MDGPDKSSPDGILQHISNDVAGRFLSAQDTLVPVPLPQPPLERLLVVISGELLGSRSEPTQVGVVAKPLDNKMGMVRHEAARDNCEVLVASRAQKLRHDHVDVMCVREGLPSTIATERQEIPVRTDVGEPRKAARTIRTHPHARGKNWSDGDAQSVRVVR